MLARILAGTERLEPKLAEYLAARARERLLLVNIESVPAIRNLDAILAVPDLGFIEEAPGYKAVENDIDVKSDWFLLTVTTSIGTTQSTLYSLLERRGENVTVRLRSFDVK